MKSYRAFFLSEEKQVVGSKITREAFIYMEPKAPKDEFAQCGTCIHFIDDINRCELFGPDDKVEAKWSCGLYAHGKPKKKIIPLKCVSPAEAGLVKSEVRCENCTSFDSKESKCKLYEELNKLPLFDLDTKVKSKACCNAWN